MNIFQKGTLVLREAEIIDLIRNKTTLDRFLENLFQTLENGFANFCSLVENMNDIMMITIFLYIYFIPFKKTILRKIGIDILKTFFLIYFGVRSRNFYLKNGVSKVTCFESGFIS